jgi:two-component system, sensor histidine kinase
LSELISQENNIDSASIVKELPRKDLPKVLLVDDDKTTFLVLEFQLKNICSLGHAETGLESIEMVKKNYFQIILLDINLGYGMNGLTALRDIRIVPGYEKTPVVAFTAYATLEDRNYFLSAGCDYYISKPFEKTNVQEMIYKILNLHPK